jgi:division protein CdvB (Snf7/Vps24/ESCRT-III family)
MIVKILNEFKEDMNKQLSKIRKTMQNMKGQFNKEIEIGKKNQIETLEMKHSINQIKNSVHRLTNRLGQAENWGWQRGSSD